MSVFVRSGNTSRLIDEHNAIVTASASHPPLSNSPSQAARPRPEPVVRSSTPDANNTCDASQSLRGVGVEVSQGRRAGALTVFFSMPSSLHSKPRPGALGIAMLPSLSGRRGSPRTRSSKLFRPEQAPHATAQLIYRWAPKVIRLVTDIDITELWMAGPLGLAS